MSSMFTNIFWATDGSEHADRALQYAADIAQSDGAELHVVHVIEKLPGAQVAGQLNTPCQPRSSSTRGRARRRCRTCGSVPARSGPRISSRRRAPWAAITRHAQARQG